MDGTVESGVGENRLQEQKMCGLFPFRRSKYKSNVVDTVNSEPTSGDSSEVGEEGLIRFIFTQSKLPHCTGTFRTGTPFSVCSVLVIRVEEERRFMNGTFFDSRRFTSLPNPHLVGRPPSQYRDGDPRSRSTLQLPSETATRGALRSRICS